MEGACLDWMRLCRRHCRNARLGSRNDAMHFIIIIIIIIIMVVDIIAYYYHHYFDYARPAKHSDTSGDGENYS